MCVCVCVCVCVVFPAHLLDFWKTSGGATAARYLKVVRGYFSCRQLAHYLRPCICCVAMPLHHSRIRARIPTRATKPQLDSHSRTKDNTFASTKDDKRRIKHSSFVSRIEKASQKPKKRRRPSKKLVTNLGSLVDALPSLDKSQQSIPNRSEGMVIPQKTLKSRPGAMKKKAKLERIEIERFNRNLAQLADRPTTATEGQPHVNTESKSLQPHPSTSSWQALRNFISTTMDHAAPR